MRRYSTVLAAAILAVGVAGATSDLAAQGQGQARGNQQGQNRRPIRFQEMDTNNDRVITRQEWRGTQRSFQVHDWNNDGILSGEEVRVGGRRQQQQNRGAARDLGSVWAEQTVDDWTPEHYRQLDRNSDGRVTAAEWWYDRETFRRIDHNSDNWISLAEFTGNEEVDDDREDLFEYLDANNDSQITRAEWHGTVARFNALDRDRNGVLTRAEASGTEAPADLFNAIDANNDRYIARAEWRWSASSFDVRDVNKDNRLSRDEFIGMVPSASSAYRSGYERGLTEGRAAGREDRVRNQGWDLEGQRELVNADSGYQASMGSRTEYQSGYREGFRRGYREGWDQR